MFVVKAKFAFKEKRDADRCKLALHRTVFDRCYTTHFKMDEEDDECFDRRVDH